MKITTYIFIFCMIFTSSCRTNKGGSDDTCQPCTAEEVYASGEWWKSFNDPILNTLIEDTVAYNHDLKAAHARICESRAMAKSSYSDLFPDVNITGTAQKYRFSENGIFPLSTLAQEGLIKQQPQFFDTGFDVCWEIDLFGVKRNKVIAAKEQICQSIENHYELLISLTAEVARNYMVLRKDQQILATLNQRLSIQREIISDLENKRRTGLASELQVSLSITREKEIQGELTNYEASTQTSIHKIGILTGRNPKALESLLEEEHPLPQSQSFEPEFVAANILLQRPDVRAAERALKAQKAMLKSAKGMMMPNLWMYAFYRLQSLKLSDLFQQGSQYWFLGPLLNWRLFERYELEANLQLENARYKRITEEYCQQILIAFEDIDSSYVEYKQSEKRHQYHQEAIQSSQNTVNITDKLLDTGLGTYSDSLEAKAAHTIQQENAIKVEAQLNIHTIRLYKALGGGWKHFAYETD
jgi:outer membrane protein, multidrug efflux system